ncbi:hypothetical protein E3P77_03053 [Wallemia ichthyophaga]|uniref:Endonuclease III homolog n=2 Tax=Wallemia ichthyophaga TaxID=245174 RepID=A0A4T0H4U2_WALIC|nr:Endonuclease III-like protein [Wallemia ichthyophaga EXF-994]TIA97814.1 hypothetical protein E3P94_03161 [Wallemia ichthyophaga]EOQ99115.1 Endonuclease III-like protein [Wallemia ichthyophaga EXF-994]TIA98523.1 hypothetical protein E3P95_02447 [Wallemia ichthyophaga]TIB10300.1 hypothetical protein E3P90_02904 [Wallemia ichthyophaga]TIB10486.1 hypothetical protein E3P93_02861 [Wallemia ichthyophaga]
MSSSPSPPPLPPAPSRRLRSKRSGADSRVTMVEFEPEEKTVPLKRSKSSTSAGSKTKKIQRELDVPHDTPQNWERVYNLIKDMRSLHVAPVDTLGCEREPTEELDARTKRYQVLVSLMLSSQTKDPVTSEAVDNLRHVLEGGLTLESVLAATDKQIQDAIGKVGFWRRKTEYLKKAAVMLKDKFDGDVPKDIDDLCSLPGVGPKMGFLALQAAWNQNDGIGVDVHVHRITNRLGWHNPPTTQAEQTRLNLQSWLPKELHRDINKMLVGFGQTICLPVGPKCHDCKLPAEGLCPSARKVGLKKGKRELKREETVEQAEAAETKKGEQLAKVEVILEGEH